jgi:hypothetical protein
MARPTAMSSVLAVLLASASLPGAAPPARAEAGAEFSEAERNSLQAGRLVTRRRTERQGSTIHFGGTSFQTIERPLHEVWRAVRNPSMYRELLPNVHAIQVVERSADDAVVRFEHTYGPIRAGYHLRLTFSERSTDVSFVLDTSRPNDVRSARGFLTLSPWPNDPNRTLVSWGILAGVDDGFVSGLVRPQLHDWMLRVPTTMRRFLQGRGRTRFLADSGSGETSEQ